MTAAGPDAAPERGFDVVTFLSDFGLDDVFVGVCRGVLADRAPHARVIDLTHAVDPGDVGQGATLLSRAVGHLPASVHLAVVDPGVGTSRRGIAVRAARGDVLVGPDNGLLLPPADELGGIDSVHALSAAQYRRDVVSATFHGRDVFAPAAAAVACGVPIADLGAPVDPDELVAATKLEVVVEPGGIVADVALVDRFGNVQLAATRADGADAGLAPGTDVRVSIGEDARDVRYVTTFGDLPNGELGLYEDSDGMLALAVNGGSAAEMLDVDREGRVALDAVSTR